MPIDAVNAKMKAQILAEALPYIRRFHDRTIVVKYGGKAMVDELYLPLGVVLVHFETGGINKLHAHFGKWLRIYPKDILRGMSEVSNWLRQHSIFILVVQFGLAAEFGAALEGGGGPRWRA